MPNTKEKKNRVTVIGVSGPVSIDAIADREPNFIVKGFDQQARYVDLIECRMYLQDGNVSGKEIFARP